MKCEHPLRILPKDSPVGKSRRDKELPRRYRDIYPMHRGYIEVPCGKCIACLRNRQNAMVSRLYADASKYGEFVFVTLTYDEPHLPLAESVYRCCVETGECERVGLPYVDQNGKECVEFKARIIHGHRAKDWIMSDRMRKIKPSPLPRYIDRPLFDGLVLQGYTYFARITPSACREDVRLWLKRCRVEYPRETCEELPDFKYACVTEYGPKTCRPHYHLCFLGLPESIVRWFVSKWTYGSPKCQSVEKVNRINKDKTDGYRLASQYIGKYMTKGKFECDSVKLAARFCDAEKPRLFQSIGLGDTLVQQLRDYMYAYDYIGRYDPKTLFSYDKNRYLTSSEILSLVPVVCKRFTYTIGISEQTKKPIRYAVPRIIRQKVFGFTTKDPKTGKEHAVTDAYGRRKVSPIFLLASRYLQDQYASLCERKLVAFLSSVKDGEIAEAVSSFALRYESGKNPASSSRTEDYLRGFYGKSIF